MNTTIEGKRDWAGRTPAERLEADATWVDLLSQTLTVTGKRPPHVAHLELRGTGGDHSLALAVQFGLRTSP
jgi:hypothetical protein